ncbi:GGDEF domain-containing protein [Alkalicoccus urumqiensis]|uniref:GGDEF domain-containing protein n=1 Tax=Alkalicoccus urumqiensis TaxID=1548213 RepID=A0A2P6MDA4_ALKUR|nr:GGDEF domain-containing protein [Alkalicoccus urumqiensis]PRO64252.1 hypothetical protein C6I21_15710 [Alkalicoccus urumqiensis]
MQTSMQYKFTYKDIHRMLPGIIGTYIIMGVLFYALGLPVLGLLNTAGGAVLLLLRLTGLTRRTKMASLLIFLQMLLHLAAASFTLGSYSGFYLYIFIYPIFGLVSFSKKEMMVVIPISALAFSACVFLPPPDTGALSYSALTIFFGLNAAAMAGFSFYVFYQYFKRNQELLGELNRMAFFDMLTGLCNRRAMTSLLKERTSGKLLLLDIDDFKKVNDTYGHPAGDEILQSLAGIIQQEMPPEGTASRWGGEEFLLYLPEATVPETNALFQRILKRFARLTYPGMALSVSGGACALADPPYHSFSCADNALYQSKTNGKARLHWAELSS